MTGVASAPLTTGEREALLRAWPWPKEAATTADGFGDVTVAVEAIIATRLARVRLAATEWCHGEATSDQAMSAVLGSVGCQSCGQPADKSEGLDDAGHVPSCRSPRRRTSDDVAAAVAVGTVYLLGEQ